MAFKQEHRSGANSEGKYCLPSQSVVDIVDTTRDPSLGISPNGRWLSFWDNPPLKSIEEVEKASIKKVSINSLLKPHKERNFGLLKDNIKLREDFGELDDEITELFND